MDDRLIDLLERVVAVVERWGDVIESREKRLADGARDKKPTPTRKKKDTAMAAAGDDYLERIKL